MVPIINCNQISYILKINNLEVVKVKFVLTGISSYRLKEQSES